MIKFIALAFIVNFSTASVQQSDIAYDRLAHRLELIRNQMELTIENNNSLESDIGRQRKEIMAFDLFLRIPMAKSDLKSDKELLGLIRSDLDKAATDNQGFRVRSVKFGSKWRSAPKKVPGAVPYDEGYRAPENQIVDRRNVIVEVEFDRGVPSKPDEWMYRQQSAMRRLVAPVNVKKWKKVGKRLVAEGEIFRYREFEYPRFLAPDLSRYVAPGSPTTQVQSTAAKRIQKYRRDIVELWPRVQPHLDNVRTFAINDLRMSFFLKHVKVDGGHNH